MGWDNVENIASEVGGAFLGASRALAAELRRTRSFPFPSRVFPPKVVVQVEPPREQKPESFTLPP